MVLNSAHSADWNITDACKSRFGPDFFPAYLRQHLVDLNGKLVGKYTSPMDGITVIQKLIHPSWCNSPLRIPNLGGLCFHFAALAERIQGEVLWNLWWIWKSLVLKENTCKKTNAANWTQWDFQKSSWACSGVFIVVVVWIVVLNSILSPKHSSLPSLTLCCLMAHLHIHRSLQQIWRFSCHFWGEFPHPKVPSCSKKTAVYWPPSPKKRYDHMITSIFPNPTNPTDLGMS